MESEVSGQKNNRLERPQNVSGYRLVVFFVQKMVLISSLEYQAVLSLPPPWTIILVGRPRFGLSLFLSHFPVDLMGPKRGRIAKKTRQETDYYYSTSKDGDQLLIDGDSGFPNQPPPTEEDETPLLEPKRPPYFNVRNLNYETNKNHEELYLDLLDLLLKNPQLFRDGQTGIQNDRAKFGRLLYRPPDPRHGIEKGGIIFTAGRYRLLYPNERNPDGVYTKHVKKITDEVQSAISKVDATKHGDPNSDNEEGPNKVERKLLEVKLMIENVKAEVEEKELEKKRKMEENVIKTNVGNDVLAGNLGKLSDASLTAARNNAAYAVNVPVGGEGGNDQGSGVSLRRSPVPVDMVINNVMEADAGEAVFALLAEQLREDKHKRQRVDGASKERIEALKDSIEDMG